MTTENSETAYVLKMPRIIESDPLCDSIEQLLAKNQRPLWRRGTLSVPHLPLSPSLVKALHNAKNIHQIERGLEGIEKILANESKGLDALRKKQGTPNANRISRLLIVSSDGSERFYRQCESILAQHSDRVLGIWIGASAENFTKDMFGAEKISKALLVSDRDSVADVLYSLVEA